ncbi:tetratricopeptide repeat protein [Mucilaginibacter robiniae]|uniref:Tetratricopeptide repeat protein n=1 Tax=Mucilaginibacter robiniae TaxID=2728022 RepID=A0A7L5E2N5_9SPHI|nr:tetratricopeptide repeat protein [Mucilaginibacter robiniae]QJD96697.1 tetratricopeptide repeat protein [Mucilaginibacter robiniae]
MNWKQIVAVGSVMVVMGYLYMQPVKGLIKPPEGRASAGAAQVAEARPIAKVTVQAVSEPAKAAIGGGLSVKINELEAQLKKASSAQAKLDLQKQLAQQWDAVNQPAPAAFYYQEVAQSSNTFNDWLSAGNRFNDAFKFSQDTTVQPAFVVNAIQAFKKARALDEKNMDAESGLGIAYVNQTSLGMPDPEGGSPMQGIQLLLDVVGKDPSNRNANLNLGQFAMKSGQYQKAVDRFKKMIAQKPELEPYFYLAESYKQLGMKAEAIDAYEKCKDLMPDQVFQQRINEYIKELKN